jgi:hypothetical protein
MLARARFRGKCKSAERFAQAMIRNGVTALSY